MFSNRTYDVLKWISIIFFPAFITLVGTIGLAVNWKYTDLTVVILTAIATFMGALLGESNRQYNKEN